MLDMHIFSYIVYFDYTILFLAPLRYTYLHCFYQLNKQLIISPYTTYSSQHMYIWVTDTKIDHTSAHNSILSLPVGFSFSSNYHNHSSNKKFLLPMYLRTILKRIVSVGSYLPIVITCPNDGKRTFLVAEQLDAYYVGYRLHMCYIGALDSFNAHNINYLRHNNTLMSVVLLLTII